MVEWRQFTWFCYYRVDLEKYPVFSKVQYHGGHMYSGDCVYIPSMWVRQVGCDLVFVYMYSQYSSLPA